VTIEDLSQYIADQLEDLRLQIDSLQDDVLNVEDTTQEHNRQLAALRNRVRTLEKQLIEQNHVLALLLTGHKIECTQSGSTLNLSVSRPDTPRLRVVR
jgi:septal ring factor EnvC (AmiA/AmiB activator)